MTSWKVTDAEGEVRDALTAAICGRGPQHLLLEGEGEAVVMRADEYVRLVGEIAGETTGGTAPARVREAQCDIPVRTGADLLETMRNSPWAEAVRTGFWPWVWDDDTRDWVLPEENAVSP